MIASVIAREKPLSEAVSAFDEETRARGATEIEVTYKQSFAMHHYDVIMDSPIAKYGIQKID